MKKDIPPTLTLPLKGGGDFIPSLRNGNSILKNGNPFKTGMLLLLGAALCFTLSVQAETLGGYASSSSPPSPSPSDEPSQTISEPDTRPIHLKGQTHSPLSIDNPSNIPGSSNFELYNTFPRDLNLWELEKVRFFRSPVVISPDKTQFAYTEVSFLGNLRQTISSLYLVQTPLLENEQKIALEGHPQTYPPPPNTIESKSATKKLKVIPLSPEAEHNQRIRDQFSTEKTLQRRHKLLDVGSEQAKLFDFKTLTIVDWSATGQRLLIKERSGILHVGLQTSNILIFDQRHGTVTIYPEIHRIIQYYWRRRGNLPNIDQLSWDIQPLGWVPDSDSEVLLKAWAYDLQEKKFLGLWRYDIVEGQTKLISLQNTTTPVAANGWTLSPH